MAEVKVEITKKDNTKYTINRFNGLESLESLSQSTPNPQNINYGVFANTGTIKITDVNGEIAKMIENGEIDSSNVPISIFFNGNEIANHISSGSEYDSVNKQLTIQLTNTLEMLDLLSYKGRKLTAQMSAYDLLEEILTELNYTNIQDMMSADTKTRLENITIKYPYLEASTYRQAINKICQLGQLNAYNDKNGNLRFEYLTPFLTSSDINNIAVIPQHYQFSQMPLALFKQNVIDRVKYNRYKIKASEQEIIQTFNITVFDNGTRVVEDTTNYNKEFKNTGITVYSNNCFFRTTNMFLIEKDNIIPQFLYQSLQNSFYAKVTKTYSSGYTEDLYFDMTTSHIFSNDGVWYEYTSDGLNLKIGLDFQFHWTSGGSIVRQDVYSIKIDIYGKTYSFEQETLTQGSGTNEYELQTNELFTNETTYNNTPIGEYISNNLIQTYKNGLSTSTLTILCADFYNLNGTKLIDFENGEIVNVSNLIKISQDNKTWLVTGAKPRNAGCPYIDLELLRKRFKYNLSITIGSAYLDKVNLTVTRNGEQLQDGDLIFDGETLNITMSANSNYFPSLDIYENNTRISSQLKNKGNTITYTYKVNGDVDVRPFALEYLLYDFNKTIQFPEMSDGEVISYNIDFTNPITWQDYEDKQGHYIILEKDYRSWITDKRMYYSRIATIDTSYDRSILRYTTTDGWQGSTTTEGAKRIRIYGGADLENETFIKWLNENATLILS